VQFPVSEDVMWLVSPFPNISIKQNVLSVIKQNQSDVQTLSLKFRVCTWTR